jgi:hypothetical protein
MFAFESIAPIPIQLVEKSQIQKALLFELSMVRAELLLRDGKEPNWENCLQLALKRQSRHHDVRVPDKLEQCDFDVAIIGSQNLLAMLKSLQTQHPDDALEISPSIPGLGWIASGTGDFSLGQILIEVKHTDRNFIAGDFRQVLMYWLLKYAHAIEGTNDIWTNALLLNPRRNAALLIRFDYLLRSASANSSRVELLELLRSMVVQEQIR